jgi:proliferating cell nuclear antigen PCNA
MRFVVSDKNKATEWIEIFKFLKNMNQYVTILCKPEEAYLQMMDSAHVCLVDIILPASWFAEYECSNTVAVSVTSSVLVKLLSIFSFQEDKSMEFNVGDEEETLEIVFQGTKQVKAFQLPLITIEQDFLSPTMAETKMDFMIQSKFFEKYIAEASLFGEELTIECADDTLSMEASSEQGKIKIVMNDVESLLELNVIEDFRLSVKYPLKYLAMISKFALTYQKVHLFVDEESPLRISFDSVSELKFNYFLAPKTSDYN